MNPMQMMVSSFNSTFGCVRAPRDEGPQFTTPKNDEMRLKLIEEEVKELRAAVACGDRVLAADALFDILYVTFGAADVWNMDMEPLFVNGHLSNMSKTWCIEDVDCFLKLHPSEGFHAHEVGDNLFIMKRADGKVIKPGFDTDPTMSWVKPYKKADFALCLKQQDDLELIIKDQSKCCQPTEPTK